MGKGISQIATAAMYVGITVTAISAALTVGVPALEEMRDSAALRKAQNFMHDLDSNVRQVISEGEGSTRTLTVNLDRGRMFYENDSNAVVYELETGASVISPQSSRRSGNVVLSSSANVDVYNVTAGGPDSPAGYTGPDCYMMENEHIKACIKKVGSPSSSEEINTSELLTHYQFKDANVTLNGSMQVKLNGIYNTSWGQGYTRVDEFGTFIATGEVRAHVSSRYGLGYDVIYRLPTGSDFLQVKVRNFS